MPLLSRYRGLEGGESAGSKDGWVGPALTVAECALSSATLHPPTAPRRPVSTAHRPACRCWSGCLSWRCGGWVGSGLAVGGAEVRLLGQKMYLELVRPAPRPARPFDQAPAAVNTAVQVAMLCASFDYPIRAAIIHDGVHHSRLQALLVAMKEGGAADGDAGGGGGLGIRVLWLLAQVLPPRRAVLQPQALNSKTLNPQPGTKAARLSCHVALCLCVCVCTAP